MQLENLNNDKLRYVARMPRIPTPYARYINLHARVRINSSRYNRPSPLNISCLRTLCVHVSWWINTLEEGKILNMGRDFEMKDDRDGLFRV